MFNWREGTLYQESGGRAVSFDQSFRLIQKIRQRRFEFRTVTPSAEGSLDGLFNLLFKPSFDIRHLVAEGQLQMRVTKDQGDEC